MSDKIRHVTPREIAEMIVNEQAYADTRFVLATEHDAEIERLRARVEVLESALTRTSANLMAAISLLKAGGRDAAPSDKMFRKMLDDYEEAVQDGREKLLEAKP